MLVECGFVRAVAPDGQEFSFTPSLGRIATLGSPHEIVALYAALHGPDAPATAAYVLACLCDQDDPTPLIGGAALDLQDPAAPPAVIAGSMPVAEQVIVARHLMQHGIVGTAKPSKGDGKFSDAFHAAEYTAAARVHLGLSSTDAEALSMTEFQQLFAMKFPEANKERSVPSREEYDAAIAAVEARRGV